MAKTNGSKAVNTTSSAKTETPTPKAKAPTATEVTIQARLAALEAELKEKAAKALASETAKAEKAAAREAKAAKRMREYNPFCVAHTLATVAVGARVYVVCNGAVREALVTGQGQGSALALKIAGVEDLVAEGKAVEMNYSFIYATEAAARDALKAAYKAATTPLTDLDYDKQKGTGQGKDDHTGRLVCVFRPTAEGYLGVVNGVDHGFGYSIGFLDNEAPAAKGLMSVYFGYRADEEHLDQRVSPKEVYSPLCYTDHLYRQFAIIESKMVAANLQVAPADAALVSFPVPKAEKKAPVAKATPAKAEAPKAETPKATPKTPAKAEAKETPKAKGGKTAKK